MSCSQILTPEDIVRRRREEMKRYPDSTRATNVIPMDQESATFFSRVCLAEEMQGAKDFRERPELAGEMSGAVNMFISRFTAMTDTRSISWEAATAACILGKSIGGSLVALCDILEKTKSVNAGKIISTRDLVKIYPFGFYIEAVLAEIVDKFMKTGVHPYSMVYGISLSYAAEFWGQGIYSREWSWPIG